MITDLTLEADHRPPGATPIPATRRVSPPAPQGTPSAPPALAGDPAGEVGRVQRFARVAPVGASRSPCHWVEALVTFAIMGWFAAALVGMAC